MTETTREPPRLFPALLKYWRGRRGLSQLDLALNADVSSRHVSFLETGRSAPSEGMVLRLAAVLDVPLREQNELLIAAGFERLFDEPKLTALEDRSVAMAIERMLAQHEPYPMLVMDAGYDILLTNRSAQLLLSRLVSDPSALAPPLNGMRMLFDPRLVRPALVGWERIARELLSRLHREALHHPENNRLSELRDELLSHPDVPQEFHEPDFTRGRGATFPVRLQSGDLELSFLTAVTAFSAPSNVTVEELRIESYFPLDDATDAACQALAATRP